MQETINSEQKKNELQLTLSRFSHEIRNPLALIQSELQLMETSHPELTEYEGWYSIMENLEYIRELLNDLSQFNNADTLSTAPTDVTALLKNISASFRPALNYLGITLNSDIPENLPFLSLDRIKIRQALLNLLRNAQESIQHSHGIILFSACQVPGGVCILIKDNGCGMTSEQLQNIFTPFVTYKDAGTGLGLSITRHIVEAHGGTLKVQSIPEKGSEFHIFLCG